MPGNGAGETGDDIRRECDRLAAGVLDWCAGRGLKIAAAESLTGGLLADAFVRIPGASRVFLGSAVTYDIAAKASVLGVDRDLLDREGAVHPEVARQMARRTAELFAQPEYGDSVIGVSTTGVAGPGPDGDKPAGLVYIGVSLPGIFRDLFPRLNPTIKLELQGSREIIRRGTVRCVLRTLSRLSESSQNNPV
ncbi:CinA family protein [Bifidobacterium choloepi]|uniref:CinA family protein n=1 Tax=Bifidobacterium choloepi TaxID=2614131 RepID=A0A6I5N1T8_9BIFI|nr:CinA family protein [Bifidobacterium choloepi]NEG70125.1 CinA family protein [Bifidobacterium choloepi]